MNEKEEVLTQEIETVESETAEDLNENVNNEENVAAGVEAKEEATAEEAVAETEEETTETMEMEPGVGLMVKEGLPTMAVGMVSIFIVIGVIILTVSLLSKIKADGNFSRGLKALFGKKDQ